MLPGMAERDWREWHRGYDSPGSALARRLVAVQRLVGQALDSAPPGELLAISLCAGQGRDLLGVLADHPRRDDVTARLVELDPDNAAVARAAARAAGLSRVEVVVGDAALTDRYVGAVPADVVLVCGVFGNITDEDVRRTVAHCACLCRTGGTVVWTRHRTPPDLVPMICDWFARHDFEQQWVSDPEAGYGVGAHRFAGQPRALPLGKRLFTFVPRVGATGA